MRNSLILNVLLLLLGCGGEHDRYYREINEEQLKVQVILPNGRDEYYGVRVFPGEAITNIKGDQNKEMLYKSDSCFYLQTTLGKQYPLYTEIVASGIKGCYEYMVYFEKAEAQNFVYDDRYFTQKSYSVDLKRDQLQR